MCAHTMKKRKVDETITHLRQELAKEQTSTAKLLKIIKQTCILSFDWCQFCERPTDDTIDYSSAGTICQNCNAELPCKTWCKDLRKQKRFSCCTDRHDAFKFCENCVVTCKKCDLTFCFDCMSDSFSLDDRPICEACDANEDGDE